MKVDISKTINEITVAMLKCWPKHRKGYQRENVTCHVHDAIPKVLFVTLTSLQNGVTSIRTEGAVAKEKVDVISSRAPLSSNAFRV